MRAAPCAAHLGLAEAGEGACVSWLLSLALLAVSLPAAADWVVGDARPDAPALAARGAYTVGVRTEQLVHRDQFDILRASSSQSGARAMTAP